MLNKCVCFIICDLCDMYFVYLFFKIMIKNFDFLWVFFFKIYLMKLIVGIFVVIIWMKVIELRNF